MGAWVDLNGDSGVVTGFVPAKMWVIPGFYGWKGYGWVTPELVFARVLKHERAGGFSVFDLRLDVVCRAGLANY